MISATDTAPIRIAGVSHSYGKHQAIAHVSLTLPTGRLVGLIGPDGVGKSTLLGLLSGAKALQTGSIEILGGSIADPAHRRRVCPAIAFMPQGLGRNLYAELSVRENLEFFSRLFGQSVEERDIRISALLKATGLAPFADRLMGNLSGGMKQKLGLCCALIHDPDVLILDEPTTGVDPLSRRQFWALIDALRNQNPALTVVVSTAYMEEAERFDWIVAMDVGRALFQGTPMALKGDGESLEDAYRALQGNAVPQHLPTGSRNHNSGEPVITARGLTRRFGDFTAVDRVNFSINRGEIFGFLGSNGCGKSTTMKMLTGLLPASEGDALLFGAPVDARNQAVRHQIGYMSQAFSLYGELTVRQNLRLHARIFGLADREARIAELTPRFGLEAHLDTLADALPLGIKQRLSLAVAVLHRPRVLILDEPTSGVDPAARDAFWALLLELSRKEGVTIFVSTHFMGEAERCDRVSFMHAGRVLAEGTPDELMSAERAETLEQAFISILEAAAPPAPVEAPKLTGERAVGEAGGSLSRALAYALRETVDVLRDRIRLAFAFVGSALLMLVFCFGVTLDIEELDFAVLDLSQSPESRAYIAEIEGSRYFQPTALLASPEEGRKRLVSGDVSLVIELPPDFGRKLRAGEATEVLATVDGAIPFKGETVEGYVFGPARDIHSDHAARESGTVRQAHCPDRAALSLQPELREHRRHGTGHARDPADHAARYPDRRQRRARARAGLGHQFLRDADDTARVPDRQAGALHRDRFREFPAARRMMIVTIFGVPLKGDPVPLAIGATALCLGDDLLRAADRDHDLEPGRGGLRHGNCVSSCRRSSSRACCSRSRRWSLARQAIGSRSGRPRYFPAPQRRRVHQGARAGRASPAGHPGARLLWADPHRPRGAVPARAGGLTCNGPRRIFWLGLKEMMSLRRDWVMMALLIWSFTLAPIMEATGVSTSVNNASIAFEDEDNSSAVAHRWPRPSSRRSSSLWSRSIPAAVRP